MIRRGLSMLAGGFMGLVSAQGPEFAQQYQQRLGGAVDELRLVVDQFDTDAKRSGLDRAGGLKRMEAANDDFLRRRAASVSATIDRFARLEAQQQAMKAEDAVSRVTAMVRNFDAQIAEAARKDFRPALPLTLEAVFFALIGFLGGAVVMAVLALPLGWRFGRRRNLRSAREA
ncbi:MAG: DUF2937 family protein [Beijerinckiaceae bacterium]